MGWHHYCVLVLIYFHHYLCLLMVLYLELQFVFLRSLVCVFLDFIILQCFLHQRMFIKVHSIYFFWMNLQINVEVESLLLWYHHLFFWGGSPRSLFELVDGFVSKTSNVFLSKVWFGLDFIILQWFLKHNMWIKT